MTAHLAPYRAKVVRANLAAAFPELRARDRRRIQNGFYRGYADVMVEIVKAMRLTPAQLRERVLVRNPEALRTRLAQGRPVLVVAAHQCNWEWLLLGLCVHFDVPVDAAYKPLVNPWAEREMMRLRTRFGARLVPAPQLLMDLLQRRHVTRIVAMNADQEPVDSERKHWVRFLNRDSAFFVGPEEIARKFRYPAVFAGMRRIARGRYMIEFEPLAEADEALAAGELTRRYARLVEAQIREAPADWPWSHKRWKLKPPLY